VSGPRIGELFAGYGGLGMGVKAVLGGEVAWVSDIDKGANKVLAHRFPGVPNLGDITTVDWSQVEPVDVLTGGSPCQDLSHAGRRAGMTTGTRSNLWVAMREAIAQLRPSLVVWENVRGAYSAEADSALEHCPGCMGDPRHRGPVLRALHRVIGDLSDLGYVGGWHGLRAADVGAPHARLRVFTVAYPGDYTADDRLRLMGREQGEERREGPAVHGRPGRSGRLSAARLADPHFDQWGPVAPSVARWEYVTGRRAPGIHDRLEVIAEWLMGLPDGWITDVPGVTRNEALKLAGNGVVPQQAEAALRFLLSVQAVAA
jgi:DNA (cytosine-5)-methyltransferase 1